MGVRLSGGASTSRYYGLTEICCLGTLGICSMETTTSGGELEAQRFRFVRYAGQCLGVVLRCLPPCPPTSKEEAVSDSPPVKGVD